LQQHEQRRRKPTDIDFHHQCTGGEINSIIESSLQACSNMNNDDENQQGTTFIINVLAVKLIQASMIAMRMNIVTTL
jgi:hypothetical protein